MRANLISPAELAFCVLLPPRTRLSLLQLPAGVLLYRGSPLRAGLSSASPSMALGCSKSLSYSLIETTRQLSAQLPRPWPQAPARVSLALCSSSPGRVPARSLPWLGSARAVLCPCARPAPWNLGFRRARVSLATVEPRCPSRSSLLATTCRAFASSFSVPCRLSVFDPRLDVILPVQRLLGAQQNA
jgi:hypothetical protein